MSASSTFVAERASAIVRFGTQNPAHPWWSVGERVTEALVGFSTPALLPSVRISMVTPSALQGARNNPIEVSEGALEFGITTPAVTAKMAMEGTGVYDRPYPGLRAIASYPHIDFVVFMVDAATGITSLRQLVDEQRPLRVVTGRKSGDGQQDILTFTVEEVLRRYGASYERIEEWGGEVIYGGPTHIGGYRMLEGAADALFQEAQTARVWHEIADSRDVRVLGVAEDVIEGMRRDFGFARAAMPAGHYRGVVEETATVDFSGWLLFCREDVPDEWAYAFARACDETKEQVEAYPEVRRSLRTPIDPGYLFTETVIPLHDGAAAYARERGYLAA
jgi:TRAP-type uncharacterized transport system substrate-binding protein